MIEPRYLPNTVPKITLETYLRPAKRLYDFDRTTPKIKIVNNQIIPMMNQ